MPRNLIVKYESAPHDGLPWLGETTWVDRVCSAKRFDSQKEFRDWCRETKVNPPPPIGLCRFIRLVPRKVPPPETLGKRIVDEWWEDDSGDRGNLTKRIDAAIAEARAQAAEPWVVVDPGDEAPYSTTEEWGPLNWSASIDDVFRMTEEKAKTRIAKLRAKDDPSFIACPLSQAAAVAAGKAPR